MLTHVVATQWIRDMVSRANPENIIHAVFCVIWSTAVLFLLVWTDYQFQVSKLFRKQLPDFLLNLATPLISLQSCNSPHWLPEDFQIWFKVLVLTHWGLNDQPSDSSTLCYLWPLIPRRESCVCSTYSATKSGIRVLTCGTVCLSSFALLTIQVKTVFAHALCHDFTVVSVLAFMLCIT